MKLHAMLIHAAHASGHTVIEGCVRDYERVLQWLQDPFGGAWDSAEISKLPGAGRDEVVAAKKKADQADFTFFMFSGHGAIVEDRFGKRRQFLILGDGSEVDLETIRPVTPRGILICDACRRIECEEPEALSKAARFAEAARPALSRAAYRIAYEKSIERTNPGIFEMFSCQPGQFSYVSTINGSYFTDALLRCAIEWEEQQTGINMLAVDDTFARAKAIVQRKQSVQIPQGGPTNKSGNSFPFAIALN